jgi:hypothetical protein
MTTIVGIFDAPEAVEKAAERLAAGELDAVVLDETILELEPGSVDPAIPALVPGAAAEVVAGRHEPTVLSKRDKQSVIRAFRNRLGQEYDLSEEVTEAYATTLSHGGRFMLVRAHDKDVERTMQVLRESGATRVNQH